VLFAEPALERRAVEPHVPADAHRWQRVLAAAGVLVDAGAWDAQQARYLVGRQQRFSQRQRRELIGHDRERMGAARRNGAGKRSYATSASAAGSGLWAPGPERPDSASSS
jgi:hypothetical protein